MENVSSVANVFEKSYLLFQDKSRWAKGYYNYDRDGNRCPWAEGYSFCALGSLVFFGDGDSHAAQCCLQRVSEHLYGDCIQRINDDDPEGYEKVLKALEFGMELWKDRQPLSEELGASVEQVLAVRAALRDANLPETDDNISRTHQAYREISALVDQCFGPRNG
jgi:hypothetical protein